MRLQLKAVLGITGLLAATTLVLWLGSVRLMSEALTEEVSRRGQVLAARLAAAAEYPTLVGDRLALEELIDSSRRIDDLAHICFEDNAGRALATWRAGAPTPAGSAAAQGAEGIASAGGAGAGRSGARGAAPEVCAPPAAGRGEVSHFVAEVVLAQRPQRPGLDSERGTRGDRPLGRVRLEMSLTRAREVAARANRAVAGMALPVVALGVLIATGLVRRATLPLAHLARGLEGVGLGQFDREVQAPGRDEVAHLALSFNRMLRYLKAYRDEADRVHNNLENLVHERTQQLEEANRELAAASKTKSEFLANMSHELRTPLNAILGFLSLVKEGACASREEERELLGDAHQGARHLLSVIDSILDLAKIETGKVGLQLAEVRVPKLFEEVRSILHPHAAQKSLELSFHPGGAELPPVLGDAGKLRQVLVNLVGNALKFTEHGSVRVRAEACEEKGHVRFEVQDTGIGIPPGKRHLLFGKFQQLDSSHTRRHGGTGLGLAISRALIEMMGGRIWLESPGEGQGSTAIFTVPIYRGADQIAAVSPSGSYSAAEARRGNPDAPGAPAVGPQGAGPLALVVEDDPTCREVLREIFRLGGFTVIEAATADEALLRARETRPRLVTVDLGLPTRPGAALVDGCDLIRALLRDPDTRGADLVLVSGQEPKVIRERLERARLPVAPYLFTKPIDARALLAWAEERSGSAPPGRSSKGGGHGSGTRTA